MAIPLKGEALVTVEAGEFTLAFTLGACAAVEGQFGGKPFNDVMASLQSDSPPTATLLVVIWAALKKHHGLTLDEVGNLVSLADMEAWGDGIGRALAAQSQETSGSRPPKAKAA